MGLLGGFLTLITLSGVKRLDRFLRFLIGQNSQELASQLNDITDDD
jgi:putative Mg2+ transporter-C (MgtC) family protein